MFSSLATWSTKRIALVLFTLLVAVYNVNATTLEEGDPVPNLKLPITVLKRGTLAFSPDDFPEMFKWRSSPPLLADDNFTVRRWKDFWFGKTMGEWRDSGAIHLVGPRYHLLESHIRKKYVSTFGPIPGLSFVPLAAVLRLISSDYDTHHLLQLSAGKLHGSILVAASAVLLFLTAMRYTTRFRALLLAAMFGLATCAWCVQSQNVWQQTVSTFFLCIGIYCLVQHTESIKYQLLGGFAFGTATACRHTGALLLVSVFAYMVIYHRKHALYLALGAAPAPLGIAFYNWYYFGSPFSSGQELVGHGTAMEKTGSPDLWQTPFFDGAAGLLFSPSRGLLVFSPFLIFAFWGLYKVFRSSEYRVLRPLCVGALAIMALQCKWFDWWGGWTYGYRPWLDAIPVLMLCMTPVIATLTTGIVRPAILGTLVGWSVFVQFIGAFTYDKSWNDRPVHVVDIPERRKPTVLLSRRAAERVAQSSGGTYLGASRCNIDLPYCRPRLWSVNDSIIIYHTRFFWQTRARRPWTVWKYLFTRPVS